MANNQHKFNKNELETSLNDPVYDWFVQMIQNESRTSSDHFPNPFTSYWKETIQKSDSWELSLNSEIEISQELCSITTMKQKKNHLFFMVLL